MVSDAITLLPRLCTHNFQTTNVLPLAWQRRKLVHGPSTIACPGDHVFISSDPIASRPRTFGHHFGSRTTGGLAYRVSPVGRRVNASPLPFTCALRIRIGSSSCGRNRPVGYASPAPYRSGGSGMFAAPGDARFATAACARKCVRKSAISRLLIRCRQRVLVRLDVVA